MPESTPKPGTQAAGSYTDPALDKPRFEHCMIDKDCSIHEHTLGDTTFRLRAVTAGEDAQLSIDCRRADPKPTGPKGEFLSRDLYDTERMWLLTVAASLGAYEQISDEGAYPYKMSNFKGTPITMSEVEHLAPGVVLILHQQYQAAFPIDRFGALELGTGG